MDNKEIALLAAKTLDSKKATDILILDISKNSGFADYFVLATASNLRQLGALCDDVEDKLAHELLNSDITFEARPQATNPIEDYFR